MNMPRQTKNVEHALSERTLVLDNGAYTMKAGFATQDPNPETDCRVIPNCLAKSRDNRIWTGNQLGNCNDFGDMVFRRPVQKGYLVNWEAEREIWDNTFFDKTAILKCDPHETNLLLTEAPNCPVTLQTNCDQMIFEEFEFAAYRRTTGPSLNAYNDIAPLVGDPPCCHGLGALPVECLLVIDSGYSHTTVTPLYRGRPIQQAIRRLDIGGKFLTNSLKEMLSIRQMDVREETHMVNQMKEDVCYVSSDFKADLELARKGVPGGQRNVASKGDIIVDYALPDYTTRMRGEVRSHDARTISIMNKTGSVTNAAGVKEYVMSLGLERFTVPELLFHPDDVGMKQAGLPETVMQSMCGVPTGLWTAMLSNVVVVGGNAKLEGFVDRFFTELRQLAPPECVVRVATVPDPVRTTWLGGARLASDRAVLNEIMVTRPEYQEHGSAWLLRRFGQSISR